MFLGLGIPTGKGRGWVVDNLPNLKFWLSAFKDSYSDGDSVPTAKDFSGLGNDATQGTASKQPVFWGDPKRFSFDGVDDYLESAHSDSLNCSSGLTLFIANKVKSKKTSANIVSKYDGTNGFVFGYDGGGKIQFGVKTSGGWDLANSSGIPPVGEKKIYCFTYNPSNSKTLHINGAVDYSGGATQGLIGTNSDPLKIGYNNYWGAGHKDDDDLEIILFDRALSDTERQKVETYLSQLTGIPLS